MSILETNLKSITSALSKIVEVVWDVGSNLVLFAIMVTPLVIGFFWIDKGRFPFDIPIIGYSSKDPNLQMTFSCHGDRRIEYFDGRGEPNVVNEKVAHSITFWRQAQENYSNEAKKWQQYKVNRYLINSDFQNLARHNGLKGNVLAEIKKKDSFYVFEKFGIFKIILFKKYPDIFKNNRNDYKTLNFNFVTRTLDIDVWERNGREVRKKTYDRTRCEQVTDPNILQEMSVI